ncbi:MAG: SDR family NAD(P)-dependent oxidoreductase [Myxococcota bacterium]
MTEPARPHVVVTGASSGIGEALARAWAAAGADLTLVARRRDRLEALAASLPVRTHVAAHDLADPEHAADFLPEAEAALGPVDVLVNNAGLQVVGRTHLVDVAAAERSVLTNLLAPLRLIHAVLPGMLARDAGTIVNISSMAALAPTPGMTWYNAGKAGFAAASEALRGELRDTKVRVVTVYPGIIGDTDMARAALDHYQGLVVRLQPSGTAEQLAHVVRRAADRGAARVIWPRANALARHFPAATRTLMDALSPLPEG